MAAATPRCAPGRPIARATSAYEMNSPKQSDATARQAAIWSGVPSRKKGKSKRRRRRAKYARTCALASTSRASPGFLSVTRRRATKVLSRIAAPLLAITKSLSRGVRTRHRRASCESKVTAFSSVRWLEVLVKRKVDRVISLIFTAYAAVFLIGAVPLDSAVIVDSGSTNTLGYRIEVRSDGSAFVSNGSSSPKPFTVPQATVERFFADLAAARKDNATTAPCVKSASFGSTLRITWQQWVSPDLTCPPKDALGAALITDVQTLRQVAGIGAAPLRQGPEIQPPH
jgi:hypothetical protein